MPRIAPAASGRPAASPIVPRVRPTRATGAVLTTRLLHSMRRDGIRRGLVTLCIGGGQGIALALEAV
jgi:hypothetical protein